MCGLYVIVEKDDVHPNSAQLELGHVLEGRLIIKKNVCFGHTRTVRGAGGWWGRRTRITSAESRRCHPPLSLVL